MVRIELTIRIAAPREVCFDLARSVDFHTRSTAQSREVAGGGRTTGLLSLGEEVTWQAKHDHHFVADGPHTVMRDGLEFAAPLGLPGRLADVLVLRSYLLRLLETRNRQLKAVAEAGTWRHFVPAV